MLILTSPAKSLDLESDFHTTKVTQPQFLSKTGLLDRILKKKNHSDLKKLLGISDKLTDLNHDRFQNWESHHGLDNSRPSLFTFKGDVFKELDLDSYHHEELDYAQDSLLTLSGFYGVLRPLDLMQPYRLEMGTKIDEHGIEKLSDFWKQDLTNYINSEVNRNNHKLVLNLASIEYSSSIDLENLDTKVVNVIFKQKRKGGTKTYGILAKKARGMMIDFCIKNRVDNVNQVEDFKTSGYKYNKKESDKSNLIFTQQILPH